MIKCWRHSFNVKKAIYNNMLTVLANIIREKKNKLVEKLEVKGQSFDYLHMILCLRKKSKVIYKHCWSKGSSTRLLDLKFYAKINSNK